MIAAAKAERAVLKWSGLALLAAAWETLARTRVFDPQFFPSFTETVVGVGKMLASGLLFTSVMVSLWRASIGLLIAIAAAIPLGLFFGRCSKDAADCFNPFFRMLAQVNPFSLMPIFILFFGIGEAMKIAVVAWVCLWPVFFNTFEGAQHIDPAIIKLGRATRTPPLTMLRKIILPGASASIFTGLRLGLEMSFFMLIAAEMVGATYGIGWLVHNSSMNWQFVRMYAAFLCTVALGWGMSAFLKRVHRRVFFWQEDLPLGIPAAGEKKQPFAKTDFALTGALCFLIFVLGTWQIRVAQRNLQDFTRVRHEHRPIQAYREE